MNIIKKFLLSARFRLNYLIRKFPLWLTWYRYNHRKKNYIVDIDTQPFPLSTQQYPVLVKSEDVEVIDWSKRPSPNFYKNLTQPTLIRNQNFDMKSIFDMIEPVVPMTELPSGSHQFINREGNGMIVYPNGWTMEYIYHTDKTSNENTTKSS